LPPEVAFIGFRTNSRPQPAGLGTHEVKGGSNDKGSDNRCNSRLDLFRHSGRTQSTDREGANKIEPLPRDLEIQLALSALPPHLRDNATVYVLSPDMGFEIARKGTNGFHALVARTGDDTFRALGSSRDK